MHLFTSILYPNHILVLWHLDHQEVPFLFAVLAKLLLLTLRKSGYMVQWIRSIIKWIKLMNIVYFLCFFYYFLWNLNTHSRDQSSFINLSSANTLDYVVLYILRIKGTCKRNFKWPFLQKWQCPIHNGIP